MAGITKSPVFKAISLGIIAGMRTFYAPAVFSHLYRMRPAKSLAQSPLAFMQSTLTSKVFKVLAAGELVGDKLPNTPNRTAIPGVAGRVLSGALVGASVYKASGRKLVTGALIGGVAAVASTYGCFFLRKAIVKSTRISDPYIGSAEDALVIGAGIALSAAL